MDDRGPSSGVVGVVPSSGVVPCVVVKILVSNREGLEPGVEE